MRLIAASLIAICAAGAAFAQESEDAAAPPETGEPGFFVTSVGSGSGGDLGGLEGADAHCASLARAAGLPDRDWRAYLSTTDENARDRIGEGPWYNANGALVAEGLVDLHGQARHFRKETALTETGEMVPGRDDDVSRRDILTGSLTDGTLATDPGGAPLSCADWTSEDEAFRAMVGHSDRSEGGGTRNPASWNSAHTSLDCTQKSMEMASGAGLFYCFAAD